MNITFIFPVILITLNICAALTYAYFSDWRMFLYWVSAATLTTCVTFRF